ncbi:ABC transporter ATP-binding protein [Yinghuangia sp. YIM S10712]|uniref:ABC transporter ATP-binding protein n=1 Tax=Yinghuangia sp. YIM S10712 TaxID=3436930 RepID=UPI003F53C658
MNGSLETVELRRAYGSFVAVDGVDLTVGPGARRALIGPNGAGKTTLLNLIAGTDRPTGGRILWEGRDVTWHSQRRRFRAGIGRTFQHPSVVPGRTVLDNVLLGAWHRPATSRLRLPGRTVRELTGECRDILATLGLADLADRQAGDLSHGQRRMIDLATALAGRPRLLLLDEPAAGLTDDGIAALLDALRELPETVAVVLVEHNLDVVAAFAHEVTVLHHGRPLATGTPAEVQADEAVREAYLGRRKVTEAV